MQNKKSQKANLENKRSMFFQIGLVLALAVVFMAMEYNNEVDTVKDMGTVSMDELLEELPPVTRQKDKPAFIPPPLFEPEELIIVDNDEELDEELELIDTDITEGDVVELVENIGDGEEEEDSGPVEFFALQDKPEFPGGEKAMWNFLSKKVKYPTIAQENGVSGTVYVGFIIGKEGDVEEVRLLRGADPSLDKEALRVVKSMPQWKPGRQNGRAVRVSFRVPIKFQLN
ncbi:energy transducer TonB [Puteibacter caeruleilacunae]|nr:energy transducer TonB [Puteibacter caeruleilacunae]